MSFPEQWPRKKICVAPASAFQAQRNLFDVLGSYFPAHFIPFTGLTQHIDAALVLNETVEFSRQLTESSFPVFVAGGSNPPETFLPRSTTFVGTPSGQPWLRGCAIKWKNPVPHRRLDVAEGEEVIAVADEQPVWVQRRNAAGFKVVRVGSLPELTSTSPFVLQLIHGAFATFLPLLDFLREVTASIDYEAPPTRACFMFDDPNLHSTSYGHLDFRKLVQEAQEYDYHVAMATVPLDTWYTNSAAASLFRSQAHRISLLIHGVNHVHAELLRTNGNELLAGDLLQALRLVERLEQRRHLRISRVMAPPHHACSPSACKLMLDAGYPAACVSWTALYRWNANHLFSQTFGLGMTEFLEGFPVIPRFNFADRDDARIFLAAFLRQPVVMIGHHSDVADGLKILAETAATVHKLPDVKWCGMDEIAQHCFLVKRTGSTLWIKLHTRRAVVEIPPDVDVIYVDRPWMNEDGKESLLVQRGGSMNEIEGGRVLGPISVGPGQLILNCQTPEAASPRLNVSPRSSTVWPLLRRLMCEARDRARI